MTQPADPAVLLKALIACRSVTPAEGGALAYLAEILASAGFAVERVTFSEPGTPDVENLFATIGSGAPHLVFAGHTDVVPPGDAARWSHPPFAGEVAGGAMYGRGAVDMKGGIAAFVAAALDVLAAGKTRGTLSLLITGDEEGPSVNGTVKLLDWALQRGNRFDAALVGEPTSRARLGDTIKIGRRGTQSGTVVVSGKQGHVAYPHLADNPLRPMTRILHRLTNLKLDDGNASFEPSNLEVVSVDVGNAAFNVIPAEARANFNVRFNDRWTSASVRALLTQEIASAAGEARHAIEWHRYGESFLTQPGPLVEMLAAAVREETGAAPERTNGGGNSDARFFKDVCPVGEVGLVGDTMHQVDERVPLADLTALTGIYRAFLERFLAAGGAS
ncbi:succinyl-diaminopimelate desuccinylase [soil metagenome]